MTDIVLDLQLKGAEDDLRLSEAIDTFLTLQESGARGDGFDLDVMVRTVFDPGGELVKQIIFQSHELADAFVSFWTAFRALS